MQMKHWLFVRVCSLAAALALAAGLAGCASTPESVGRIGEVDVPAGTYLLAQYDAYQQAADLAADGQDPTDVGRFLRQEITPKGGEPLPAGEYIARQTRQNLDRYAAIETRFAALGGALTPAQEALADSYTQQLLDQYGPLYEANGIGEESLRQFERLLLKEQALLELVYGPAGETPVPDAELAAHAGQEMVQLAYAVVPLYHSETFAPANEAQKAEMLRAAQAAADAYTAQAAAAPDAQAQLEAFRAAAAAGLPAVYAALGDEAPADLASAVDTALLGRQAIEAAFTQAAARDALAALGYGEAAVLEYSDYALMLALRLDPLALRGLEEVRAEVLADYKAAELRQALADYGAALPHALDEDAMARLPARKIVTK